MMGGVRPHFTPVLPDEVKKALISFKRKKSSSTKLYQTIGDRRRPLRSKMYLRYALSKVTNKKIRAIRDDIRLLSRGIEKNGLRKRYVGFENIEKLEKAVPELVSFSQKMEELVHLFERLVLVRREYYSLAGKGARTNGIVDNLDREANRWRRMSKKFDRMAQGKKMLLGDVRHWKGQIAAVKESLAVVQAKYFHFSNKVDSRDVDARRVAEAEHLNALHHFYSARANQFMTESKIFRLYGILLKDRSLDSINEDVRENRKKAEEADKKIRRLFR